MSRMLSSLLAAFVVATTSGARAPDRRAATPEAPLPRPAEVQGLEVHPTRINLDGSTSAQQLIVTGFLSGGRLADLTGAATCTAADRKVVRILRGGRVVPRASGSTEIVVQYGDHAVRVPVQARRIEEDLPINFGNQVVPVFTKLGCNSGGCHGKATGQNGFKISLLGFEPEVDYAALVNEARGRRLMPAAPDSSLLLLKASGTIAHGGGKRFEVGSDEYRLIRRWIAAGMPFGKTTDPVVDHLEVYPSHRILSRHGRQQLAVQAHYSDGSVEDITRLAQYESNDQEIAVVDSEGLVRTLALSGEAAVMARYQSHVTTFRATVPLGQSIPDYVFQPGTIVDEPIRAKWKQLGIVPSEPCTDEQLVRRTYLDITGTLPTPGQLADFVADTRADRYDRLVDRLLDSPEYSYYFANKWADILRVKRANQPNRAYGTYLFHGWLREAIAADKPYDEMARDILAAVGDEWKSPPTVWYKDIQTPDQFVDNAAQVFLGMRLQCAQCHHHPYEKWSQDDYWGMAAFYGRLGVKTLPVLGAGNPNQQNQRRALFTRPAGSVTNKRTNRPAVMKTLDGRLVPSDPELDPRQKLVDWMVDTSNPFFARAVANRYWAHFLGRGIVDPLDDMRVTNPPSNPELLDALARDLVEHGYSLKHLIRTICKSRTYQLSSMPNDYNKTDKQAYSHYYMKRLSAEVLFDAVCQVTGAPAQLSGLPQDRHGPNRAIMLPDESFPSYFLDVFGRPRRISACECERVNEANLAQTLHLLNSEEVQALIARPGGRADRMARDPRPDADKITELFLWAVGHKPSPKHLRLALAALAASPNNKKMAYEDIVWALLNTKELLFNQ